MTQSSGMVPATPAGLEREVDDLRQRFENYQRQQGAGRTTTLLVTLVILVMFVIFAWALMNKYRRDFNEADVQKAFVEEARLMQPDVQRHLQSALAAAAPKYRDEALNRFRSSGPQIAMAFRDELKDIPQHAGEEMTTQLRATIDRAMKKVEPDVRKRFPNLTEEKIRSMLEEWRDTEIAAQTKRLTDKIHADTIAEGSQILPILEKFRAPQAGDQDPNLLKIEFVEALLDYAKYLVRHGGMGDSGGDSQLILPPIQVIPAAATQPTAAAQ
jgi:hypothetical protein